MTERITQSMLDKAIERLNAISKAKYVSNDCYGYSQLALSIPNSSGIQSIYPTLGCTKKELYYMIQFALDWFSIEQNKKNHKIKERTK